MNFKRAVLVGLLVSGLGGCSLFVEDDAPGPGAPVATHAEESLPRLPDVILRNAHDGEVTVFLGVCTGSEMKAGSPCVSRFRVTRWIAGTGGEKTTVTGGAFSIAPPGNVFIVALGPGAAAESDEHDLVASVAVPEGKGDACADDHAARIQSFSER